MKIGWIAPIDKKCGIAFYAKRYATALARYTNIIACDPIEFINSREKTIATLNECDIVHIQYEVSLFASMVTNYYTKLCKEITVKKIISFHEVYDEIPNVFRRGNIQGNALTKIIKEKIWDIRHMQGSAYLHHLKNGFYGNTFLVHSQFQKDILAKKGMNPQAIIIIPLPVDKPETIVVNDINEKLRVTLGATGFINPAYDYDLLFSVLDKLEGDWQFIWIGGIRRNEDKTLLQYIQNNIDKREWRNRFIVTGWLSSKDHAKLLIKLDVYCAFFKQRSSSESLCDAIGAERLILATRIPLTEELASKAPVCILVKPHADEIVSKIKQLYVDEALQKMLRMSTKAYSVKNSYDLCAKRIMNIYESMLMQ